MKRLTYVEIDVDRCSLTYGVLPCQATLTGSPPTGTIKCFNSLSTCQDRANYLDTADACPPEQTTVRFTFPADYRPIEIDAIPSIKSIEYTPAIVNPGVDFGQRATVKIIFLDHRDSDTGPNGDPYLSERTYNPFEQGTYWGKFRARHPFMRGRGLRLLRGELGDALDAMVVRNFVIESVDGPTSEGEFSVIAKDVLKLADADRAQAPALSNGFLSADLQLTESPFATSFALSPVGVSSEYPLTGYVNVGGNEIIEYLKRSYTILLMHFENSGASPDVFIDESRYAHTVTANGNTFKDTAQFKFGAFSARFDGSLDWLIVGANQETRFAFGSDDWSIEMFIRLNATGTERYLYDGRPLGANGFYPTLRITSGNVLQYFTNSANRITGTTALTTGVWYHVVVSRTGTSTKLFLDGVQESTTFSDSSVYISDNDGVSIGINGNAPIAGSFNGWIDDVRVLAGFNPYPNAFTAPTATLEDTGDAGDIFEIIATAQFNTELSNHSAQDRVQLVLIYDGADPADIIYDLMTTYAFVPPEYILLANWQAETAAFLGTNYSAVIGEPVAVNKLVSELIEQAALSIWWDDVGQLIKLQVLRAVTPVGAFDDENVMARSLTVTEQPEKRVSQIWTYFAKINPLKGETDTDNYLSTEIGVDAQAEEDYGVAIKKIFSRWIPLGGRSVAEAFNDLQLARYRDPPRRFNFSLMAEAGVDPILGSADTLEAWPIQDETGARDQLTVYLTRVEPQDAVFEVEAEELAFATDDDPATRTVIFDSNIFNVNLRTIHDTLYADPVSGNTVNAIVLAGVIVGSNSSLPAFDVGTWPAGVTVNIEVVGRIQGRGGNGGYVPFFPVVATAGGTALYTRQAINLTSTDGEIWGGGGGGSFGNPGGNPGGGGAGYAPGEGGAVGSEVADDGTTEAGGAGYNPGSNPGGDGGGPGLAGGDPGSTGFAGAAGTAIDGDSFVTDIGGVGDIRGGQVN